VVDVKKPLFALEASWILVFFFFVGPSQNIAWFDEQIQDHRLMSWILEGIEPFLLVFWLFLVFFSLYPVSETLDSECFKGFQGP
jgi:hypothetical protein